MIFSGARNKITDPAKLRVLVVDLIDRTEWRLLSQDVKGRCVRRPAGEERAGHEESGAGQYFTPRPVIDAMVACVRPGLGEVVCDPACGTGGFLLSADEYVKARRAKVKGSEARRGYGGTGSRIGSGSGTAGCDESVASRNSGRWQRRATN